MSIIVAAAAIGALALLLVTLLILAERYLSIREDPRIGILERSLPGINCGACGFPGCRAFAEALLSGAAAPAACSVASAADKQCIAGFLGVPVGTSERRVARLACAGGNNVARLQAHYQGELSCAAAAQVAGGPKQCLWGCVGFADCERACDFDAITMDGHALPVVDEAACTACGACVTACPKDLFHIVPAARRLWVACSNRNAGDALRAVCQVACTACGKCAADAPEVIRMVDNLPLPDPAARANRAAIERCPTGAIVWIDEGYYRRGAAAPHIVRRRPLPAGAS
jgi:Na+-translocating ferredoxin:NAD+ oxidoreductase subunit B